MADDHGMTKIHAVVRIVIRQRYALISACADVTGETKCHSPTRCQAVTMATVYSSLGGGFNSPILKADVVVMIESPLTNADSCSSRFESLARWTYAMVHNRGWDLRRARSY